VIPQRKNRLTRLVLIFAGSFFLGLGIIGIFLPLIPTTPFILLAASCYARSSKRLHDWLLSNSWIGNYVKNFREGKGIPYKLKIASISILWIVIGYSVFFVVEILLIKILLIFIATGVTVHILFIKTLKH
jgi:uncharacterized membrane protein YbaN (DUF454 family)